MESFVQHYARFLTDLQYENLPEEVRTMAKKCILDGMASLCYGTRCAAGKKALADRGKLGLPGESQDVLLPGGERSSLEQGLFAAAVLARCSDLDDGHRVAMGHPGSLLIPLLLLGSQKYGKNGKEALTALIGAYEIYIRVGESINPSSYKERGFDSTGVTGAVACTAFWGRLLGVSREVLANALGISAIFAAGLIEYQNDGSMGKILCGVWAIHTALQSIRLAQLGYTGPVDALEGKKGFIQAFSNHPQPELALQGLGETWKIGEIYFKQHACMRGVHAAVDAMLYLRRQYRLTPANVKAITVHTTPFVGRLSKPRPVTEIGAQSSVEFALAVALAKGNIASADVLEQALQDPEICQLAGTIRLVMDPQLEQYVKEHPSHWGTVRLELRLQDGRTVEHTTYLPRGEAEDPLSWDELVRKFRNLLQGTCYEDQVDRMTEQIGNFEQLERIGDLLQAGNGK